MVDTDTYTVTKKDWVRRRDIQMQIPSKRDRVRK